MLTALGTHTATSVAKEIQAGLATVALACSCDTRDAPSETTHSRREMAMIARQACERVQISGTDFDGPYTWTRPRPQNTGRSRRPENSHGDCRTWYHNTEWETFPHVTFCLTAAHEVDPQTIDPQNRKLLGFHVSIPFGRANVAIQYRIDIGDKVAFKHVRDFNQPESHAGYAFWRNLKHSSQGEDNRRRYLVFAQAFYAYWVSHVRVSPTVAATPQSGPSQLASQSTSGLGSIRNP
jgi:hypothetical protein